MDGIETATILRSGRARLTPIPFVSACESTPGQIERVHAAGGLDHRSTPLDPGTPRRKVRALMQFYRRTIEYAKKSDELLRMIKTL